jgi:hypothetical protein
MARRSFKPDASFFSKIALGAIGARAVCADLATKGHEVVELENGATDTKIWKDVKRKRVRIPDLVCIHCGTRIESRAKTSPALSLSHSTADAERAWDFGMVDSDVIAFPVCVRSAESNWSAGQILDARSYWHSRERGHWLSQGAINYVRVGELRRVAPTRSSTKGVVEGSETTIAWDAIFSTRNGMVQAVAGGRITVRRDSDGHAYTWRNREALPVVVEEGGKVRKNQIVASRAVPLTAAALRCQGRAHPHLIDNLLSSPERTQRFTGIKLARLRGEAQHREAALKLLAHPEEDLYVQLEAGVYLARVCGLPARSVLGPRLADTDNQVRLEAVIALAEAATTEAAAMLVEQLDEREAPTFLRAACAWALGKIGSQAAIDRLIHAFSDLDTGIRNDALEAVVSIGAAAVPDLLPGVMGGNGDIAAGCAEAVRRCAHRTPDCSDILVEELSRGAERAWPVWLLAHLPRHGDRINTAISELQETSPEAHYAITVLWGFLDSWIAQNWEVYPLA